MHALAAETLKSVDEVLDETAGVIVAQLVEAVGLGHAQLIEGVVGQNGALERIQEADAEVVGVALGHLGVGAGDADGGDAGRLEGRAARDGDAGAVGAENDGAVGVDQLGRRGGRLVVRGLVVDVLHDHVVGLAADLNGRLDGVGVLNAEGLLLAAGAVIAGSGLEDADGDGIAFARRAAAGGEGKDHYERQGKCKDLFHGILPPLGSYRDVSFTERQVYLVTMP